MKNTELIDLTKKLISIPSVTGDTNANKQVLDSAIKTLNKYTIERFENKSVQSVLVYKEKIRPKKFRMLLNAHLDVVAANKTQFSPIIKGKNIYGRGAYDMKAAAAAEILAFKEVVEKVEYPLGLQLVTDEEVGGFNGTKFQINNGVKAEFALAGEPTDLDIDHQEKGILWYKIHSAGVNSHGAYPWRGENAIQKMNVFLTNLWKHYPVPKKETWKTTINVAHIKAENTTFNKVPDHCEVYLDIRYIPDDEDTISNNITKLLPRGFKKELLLNESCMYTDKNNRDIKLLQYCVNKISGHKSNIIVKHGGSDMRFFSKAGSYTITFGPKGAGLHSDNEWVDLSSLDNYYNILKAFLLRIK
ncbi:M20/M25/M40 family metallo-hydrolase [Candidatus Woesebacteria bacterium]|nr:MAG: M20/M25/M40 family metallo-hydrolase [Candidatus Woesebacteria bacterium]